MTRIREGNVVWDFPEGWAATKYDDWTFYLRAFQSCARGSKAVDIIAIAPQREVLWLIEAKDYRRSRRDKSKGPLADEVATKVRDTLSGVFAAASRADGDEQSFANSAVRSARVRVALHLEQPRKTSRLFPRAFDPADVQQKLRQLLRAVDSKPVVMDSDRTWPHWTTSWSPQG